MHVMKFHVNDFRAVAVVLAVCAGGCTKPAKPLDPPEVVAKRLAKTEPTEQRVEAAQDLVRHGAAALPQIQTAIKQHARDEPEVVAPLIQAAMRAEDYQSLPELFDLMEHPDERIRGRAGAAVQRLMGADYGFRAKLSRAERSKIVAQIRSEYVVLKGRLEEVYGN